MLYRAILAIALATLSSSLSAALTTEQQARFDDLKAHFAELNTLPADQMPDGLDKAQVQALFVELIGAPSLATAAEVDSLLDRIATTSQFEEEDESATGADDAPAEEPVAHQSPAVAVTDAAATTEASVVPAASVEEPDFIIKQEAITAPAETPKTYTPDPANGQVKKNGKMATSLRIDINNKMASGSLSSHKSGLLDTISNRLMPLEDANTDIHPSHVWRMLHEIKHHLRFLDRAWGISAPIDITAAANSINPLTYDETIKARGEIPKPHHEAQNVYAIGQRDGFVIVRHVLPGSNTWSDGLGTATKLELTTSELIAQGAHEGLTPEMIEMATTRQNYRNESKIRKTIDNKEFHLYSMMTLAGWFTSVDLSVITPDMVVNASNLGVADRKPAQVLAASASYGLFLRGTKRLADGTTTTWTQFFNEGHPVTINHSSHDGSPLTLLQGFYGTGSDFKDLGGITNTAHKEFDGTEFAITVPTFSALWWYTDYGRAVNVYHKQYLDAIKDAKNARAGKRIRFKSEKEKESGSSRRVTAQGYVLRKTSTDLGWKNKVVGWFQKVNLPNKNNIDERKDGYLFHAAAKLLKFRKKDENHPVTVPEGVIEEECQLLFGLQDAKDASKKDYFFVDHGHELPGDVVEKVAAGTHVMVDGHYGFGADFEALFHQKKTDGPWHAGYPHNIYSADRVVEGYAALDKWQAIPRDEQLIPRIKNGPVAEEEESDASKTTEGFKAVGSGIGGMAKSAWNSITSIF